LHARGTIFHHSQLVFHNGFVGKKYLILLNTPAKKEPYLFVKTTSQQKKQTHIAQIQKDLLRPPMEDSLLKLKDIFNKNWSCVLLNKGRI
jgi:hypothetical protein